MRSRTVLGFAVAALLLVASTGVHAQLGGLLKKKAGELLKPKPAPTETKPAPAETEPAPEPGSPPPDAGAGTPTTPAATPAARPEPVASGDPLDVSHLNLTSNVNRFVQDDQPVPEGEWNQMPYFGPATTSALRLLDDNGRVAFIQKTGPAVKAFVQSDTFGKAHADYIRQRFDAVDHGLKGVRGIEDFMKKKDYAGMEAFTKRQTVMNLVENIERQSAADIQRTLGYELENWRGSAKTATGKSQAKYQRYVKDGEALVALGTADVTRLRRGYAVLKSLDVDGPDTEDAVYAMYTKAKQESQQIAWDAHSLPSVLRQQLSAFVTVASTVDFAAETVEKDGTEKFVKAAYEKKGTIWKACFRAGQPATQAATQFAQAWLKELP
jgi:hypothetical protein